MATSLMNEFLTAIQDESILIRVGTGDNIKDFSIPKALLRKYEFFEKALKPNTFQESQTGIITFPEEEPEVFAAFTYFLYTGHLDFHPDDDGNEILVLCAKIWTFADKYLMTTFGMLALDCAGQVLDHHSAPGKSPLTSTTLSRCFEATHGTNMFRNFLTDHIVVRLARHRDGGADLGFDEVWDEPITADFLICLHSSEEARRVHPQSFPRYRGFSLNNISSPLRVLHSATDFLLG